MFFYFAFHRFRPFGHQSISFFLSAQLDRGGTPSLYYVYHTFLFWCHTVLVNIEITTVLQQAKLINQQKLQQSIEREREMEETPNFSLKYMSVSICPGTFTKNWQSPGTKVQA